MTSRQRSPLIVCSAALLICLASCEEASTDVTAETPPPQKPLHIDHPAQSSYGKAVQSAENLQEQVNRQQREAMKQADELYGGKGSESDPSNEPEEVPSEP